MSSNREFPWGVVCVRPSSGLSALVLALVLMATGATGAAAGLAPLSIEGPVAPALALKSTSAVPTVATTPVDAAGALTEDAMRETEGLPPRFALPETVRITPESDGLWQDLDEDFLLWRLRIQAPGALSVNLGFSEFRLPKGARLSFHPTDYKGLDDVRGVRVFTADDNRTDGELWTPLVQTDDVTLELLLPRAYRNDYDLALDAVNRGYRFFGVDPADKQGTCNIDVVCPEGDPWWNEINSVGVYTINGTWYCSGAMINNTAQDGTPYFLTADHCDISASNEHTVVVYWNFQSANCGDLNGGSLADNQAGCTLLATSSVSDYTLVELDAVPDPDHNVTYSGWDRSATIPGSAVTIHHPSCDEKAISFENDPLQLTSYLNTSVPGDETHLRIVDWDLGTTEPGSSGAPLYSPDHHIIGQLHGGYAACSNDDSDWYGRFFTSWGGLEPYLDPLGSGALTLDTYVPNPSGMAVSPSLSASFVGNLAGPFLPETFSYTLENAGGTALDYLVTADVAWLDIAGGAGTLPAYGTTQVVLSVNAAADALPIGDYTGGVSFVNLTDGVGDTGRLAHLKVGIPEPIVSFPLDTDPGWTMEGEWAFGVPLGGGGEYGSPDPTSGFTGANVLGYNLAGDYGADLPETHLTSTALDCSGYEGITLRFRRWLGVEQPKYDHAYLRVSNDGVDFTTVFENTIVIEDSEWLEVTYDISQVADDQEAVTLRWTMGETDGSWQYCGWNIDDIELWGIRNSVSAVGDAPEMRLSLGSHPNPFNPVTRIRFELPASERVGLDIFDVQGRLVRRLLSQRLEAGPHTVVWNGLDDAGRAVGSGVYFGRLTAGAQSAQHKMVLLK